MTIALRKAWTLPHFLAWEARQALKYEFDGSRPVAMAGGSEAQALIQSNLLFAVRLRMNRPPCRIIGSDLKLEAAGSIRYPDAMILCSPLQAGRSCVTDPVVVFEILSDSTARIDRIDKNADYRATPSIQHYVMLEQTGVAATMFSRKGEDWVADILRGPDALLSLPGVGVELPLRELYAGIDFPAVQSDGVPPEEA